MSSLAQSLNFVTYTNTLFLKLKAKEYYKADVTAKVLTEVKF